MWTILIFYFYADNLNPCPADYLRRFCSCVLTIWEKFLENYIDIYKNLDSSSNK